MCFQIKETGAVAQPQKRQSVKLKKQAEEARRSVLLYNVVAMNITQQGQYGQLKPGYNVQFAVNSEFITGIGVFSNRTDYDTLPPMMETMEKWHGKRYQRAVADSGYESLRNYRFLSEKGIEAYIKPNNYESSRTRKFKAQIGRSENMAYYQPKDYYVCKYGRILPCIGESIEHSKDGSEKKVQSSML